MKRIIAQSRVVRFGPHPGRRAGNSEAGFARLPLRIVLKTLKQKLTRQAVKYVGRATLAEGSLKGSQVPFRCLIVGGTLFSGYLLVQIFGQSVTVVERRRIWIPSLKWLAKDPRPELDLIIAILPQRYREEFRGIYDFCGPRDVKQVVKITGSWEGVRKQFHRRKRQIANQLELSQEFTCRISNDPKDFELFYHRMFVPHIKIQFGSYADIDSYEEMRKSFESGFLLLLMSEGRAVVGYLCSIQDGVMSHRRTGVLEGDERYIRSGAQTALSYFQIRLACERGLRAVNLMMSNPFLNDGVYRSKREWGAEVSAATEDAHGESFLAYFIPRASEKIASFFERNPAIVWGEKGLMGVVGTEGDGKLTEEMKKSLLKKYYAPGLQGLMKLTPKSKTAVELPFEK